MVMTKEVQRFRHLAISTIGKEFKHDFDEFSLIISSIEKTAKGYTLQGKFHAYSLGRFRFTLQYNKEKYILIIRKMFLPGDKLEHD